MSEFIQVITSRLPEVLTIVIGAILSFVSSEFFMRLIIHKIQNRTKDKFSAPIYKEIQGIRQDMKNAQEEQGKYIVKLVDEAFEKEAERKKKVYKEITSQEVKAVEEKPVEIVEDTKEETPDVVEAEEENTVETSLF
jgi:hypothetical protein